MSDDKPLCAYALMAVALEAKQKGKHIWGSAGIPVNWDTL